MAITILQQPNKYQSGYNPIKYVIDSTNKNQPGFRYVVQIFDAGTSVKLAEYDVAPDPFDNGRGKIDISRVIQNKLNTFLNLTSTVANNATTTYYGYDIKFGESFSFEWAFNDYIFITGGGCGLTTDSAFGAGFSNVTHPFQVNDQVFVQLNSAHNDCRDVINGYFTVVSVPSNKTIEISLAFPCSGPATPGKTYYADSRKIRTLNLASVTDRIAINTALSVKEYATLQGNMSSYVLSASTQNNLTNLPATNKTYPFQFMYLNMLEANSVGWIYFQNDDGDIYRKANTGAHTIKSISMGPSNLGTLIPVVGSLPLIKSTTKWYDVWVTNSSGTQQSKKIRINITNKCAINETQVLFMDRKGSYMSFAFPNRQFESITTEKEQYRKYIDTYTTSSQGDTTYHSTYNKQIRLNTDFLTDEENVYFEELLTSPYILIYYEGDWYSCSVEGGTFETERRKNRPLIKRQITARFNLDAPVNI
jgi:hypothetical protein